MPEVTGSSPVSSTRNAKRRGGVSRPVCSSVRWRSPRRGERGDGGPRIGLLASQARDDSDQNVQVDWLLHVVLKACAQRTRPVLRSGEPRDGGGGGRAPLLRRQRADLADRKSTRLNSSHSQISYAVFCLKKKKKKKYD